MISAVFKIMWLRLWRDKGALILAFILPGFIFAVFAAIFSSASGGNLDMRVSLANLSTVEETLTFSQTLQDSDIVSVSFDAAWTEADITERVRLGQDDVGVVLSGDVFDSDDISIRIIEDPSREVAATVLKGQLRQMLFDQSGFDKTEIFESVSAMGVETTAKLKDPSVVYYIGATAILFLLFSAMQGAAIAIDERRNGISVSTPNLLCLFRCLCIGKRIGAFDGLSLQNTGADEYGQYICGPSAFGGWRLYGAAIYDAGMAATTRCAHP